MFRSSAACYIWWRNIYCFFFDTNIPVIIDTTIPAISNVTAAKGTDEPVAGEPVAGLLSDLVGLDVCELLCAFDELLLSELVWEELSRTLSELFFDGESDSGTPSV